MKQKPMTLVEFGQFCNLQSHCRQEVISAVVDRKSIVEYLALEVPKSNDNEENKGRHPVREEEDIPQTDEGKTKQGVSVVISDVPTCYICASPCSPNITTESVGDYFKQFGKVRVFEPILGGNDSTMVLIKFDSVLEAKTAKLLSNGKFIPLLSVHHDKPAQRVEFINDPPLIRTVPNCHPLFKLFRNHDLVSQFFLTYIMRTTRVTSSLDLNTSAILVKRAFACIADDCKTIFATDLDRCSIDFSSYPLQMNTRSTIKHSASRRPLLKRTWLQILFYDHVAELTQLFFDLASRLDLALGLTNTRFLNTAHLFLLV